MKIEIAQITTTPGNIELNTAKIISCIKKAKKKKANLVVFPELAIPGYQSMDLLLYRDFVRENQEALKKIALQTQGITVIVGFVDGDDCRIGPDGTHIRYNSAAVIQNGRIAGVEDKTLLPDYDIFSENRYFQPAREHRIYSCSGRKIGVEICEDLWDEHYPTKVSRELIKRGAEIIINISASPFYIGKSTLREELIKKITRRHRVPVIYTNMVGSFDGYDGQIVFDGQSLAMSANGRILARGAAFREQLVTVDLETPKKITTVPEEPAAELYRALVLATKQYFEQCGFTRAYIGLSGGIDSAVCAAIAAAALGAKNVTGVSLPSSLTSSDSREDARVLAANLGIEFKTVPISGGHEEIRQLLEKKMGYEIGDLTNQNIQARLRGLILMALANENDSLLITTGNKTEVALGYCTLYGDMAGGLAPIADVDKLKVYELAGYINRIHKLPVIPANSINKAPTAELSQNQTDEQGLGAPYTTIVPIVNDLIERRGTIRELTRRYPKQLVERYWNLIRRSEFKRRQAAPGIKVTEKSFGIGRRIPISYQFVK